MNTKTMQGVNPTHGTTPQADGHQVTAGRTKQATPLSHHEPLRIALIGLSGYAACHYESIRVLEESGLGQLCAATVINPEEESDKCHELEVSGARIYSDYREMLRHEAGCIDLCCIPTGIHWHRDMTVDALAAGTHVLVEKPAAGTVEEVEAMMAAAKRAGKQVFVGFQNMYADTLWEIKRLIVAGSLGKIQRIRVGVLWPRPISYYERTDWAGKLYHKGATVFDSPANNAMAHFIMMGLFWGGPTKAEAAKVESLQADVLRAQTIESFDTLSARAGLNTGIELLVQMSHSSAEHMPAEVIVEGGQGTCRWVEGQGLSVSYAAQPEMNFSRPSFPNTRVVMLRHIVERIQGQDSPVCSLSNALEHTRLINHLHRDFNIINYPESMIRMREEHGTHFRYVKGLSESIRSAHANGCLFTNNLNAALQAS